MRTVQYSDFGIVNAVLLAGHLDKLYQIINFCIIFVRIVILSAQSMAISRYFVFVIAVVRQWWSFQFLLSSVGLCSFKQWLHFVFRFQLSPIASNKKFGDWFRRSGRVVSRCIAIAVHRLLNSIVFTHMTDNAFDCILARLVNQFLCGILSSAFVNFVILYIEWVVGTVHKLSFSVFLWWWESISVC